MIFSLSLQKKVETCLETDKTREQGNILSKILENGESLPKNRGKQVNNNKGMFQILR